MVDFVKENSDIISRLNIAEEYRLLGAVFTSDSPRASGAIECYAIGREDSKPSAFVNVKTGIYGDSAGGPTGRSISLWEAASQFDPQFGGDWRAARNHYAEKAGVKIEAATTGKGGGKGKGGYENPAEKCIFEEWLPGNRILAEMFCRKHKPGTSLEAIIAFGGRVGHYPSFYSKSGEHVQGKFKCIALPVFDWKTIDKPNFTPVSWVLFSISGGQLEVHRKGQPVSHVKMKSCGPTANGMMNEQALRVLADDEKRAKVEMIFKVGGPSDALALWSIIPQDKRETHLVTTNASGETGSPSQWFVKLIQECPAARVVIIHDRDQAGELGDLKWMEAMKGVAGEGSRRVVLPFAMKEKGGMDLRDWICGKSGE